VNELEGRLRSPKWPYVRLVDTHDMAS